MKNNLRTSLESLKGKVAIITGGAHGIGRGIASQLAEYGLKVVINDIDEQAGVKLVQSIESDGGEAIFCYADLRKETDIQNLIEQTINSHNAIDILINNARPPLQVLPFEESMKEWDMAMDILLKAPALLAKYALPYFRKNGGGNIIHIGSTNENFISHQAMSYHVAKAGLVQMTKYLACDLGDDNIRVNTISPGLVDIYEKNKPLTSNPLHKSIVDLIVPLKRAALPEDIAEMIAFLCSESASYITGQIITLDGGITLNDHFHIARKSFIAATGKE